MIRAVISDFVDDFSLRDSRGGSVYVRNSSGLARALLSIAPPEQLAGHPVVGENIGGYDAPRYTHFVETAMRTNIVLDDELVQQAFTLTGIRTKRELVHLALSELVRRRRRKDLLDLAGKVKLRPDFDHKAMRRVRGHSD